jgi:hypothetical protein
VNNDFGLSLDNVRMYAIDNYSTPDNWHNLGYELQYTFFAYLDNITRNSEREIFLQTIIDTFLQSFALTQDHVHYLRYVDEARRQVLYRAFGVSRDELAKEQPFKFIILIFYDKGPLDLRILKKSEDEINRIAISNRTRVELTKLVIIPRSKATISSKIKNIHYNEN